MNFVPEVRCQLILLPFNRVMKLISKTTDLLASVELLIDAAGHFAGVLCVGVDLFEKLREIFPEHSIVILAFTFSLQPQASRLAPSAGLLATC